MRSRYRMESNKQRKKIRPRKNPHVQTFAFSFFSEALKIPRISHINYFTPATKKEVLTYWSSYISFYREVQILKKKLSPWCPLPPIFGMQ